MNTSRFHEHLSSDFSRDDQHPEPPVPGPSGRNERTDIMIAQIREATSAPSPLTNYLKDPAVMDAIDGRESSHRRRQRESSSSTRSREPRTFGVLGVVLAEEEKQAHRLKSLLRSTGDRLDREIRRASQAVSRAEHAESRVHELTARVSKAESSKYVVELEAARATEEIKRYQLQIESLERDVKRLHADVTLLEKQRNEADESASRARDTARKFQVELKSVQARQVGREEGLKYGMQKWFKSGRMEGWDAGRVDGYENGRGEGYEEGRERGFSEGLKQGRKMGRQEGIDEGWKQGRTEERAHALQAFDDFFAAEIDERDHVTRKQAQKWSDWMRRSKDIPRLPLSAFTSAGALDTFPIPPTPSFITPTGIADAHLYIAHDQASGYSADISHLTRTHKRAVVLSSSGHAPETITASLVDAPVLAILLPFALDSTAIPEYQSPSPALTAVYDGATLVAPDAEDDTKVKTQVETPVNNLRWALQHARVVDLDIQGSIAAADASFYDSLDNLLTKSIKSDADTKRTPIVLTNVLPPPLEAVLPVVMMVNHPTYTTYRQRVSLLSLFDCVSVKLLPPPWLSTNPDKDLKNILKLFISPVLEAFGFERIIFGSSPAFAAGSPALAETWYKLVLESFRDLAVSQDDMDKIFIENATRVYSST